MEMLPPLPQGYEAVRVTQQHIGEEVDLYVRNGAHVVELFTVYARHMGGTKYLDVLDRIVNTLTIP